MKLIAETAWHHGGDFKFMKSLISDILTKTKADIIKMHITLDLEEYMDSKHELFNELSSMIFSENQWQEIISMVKKNNRELMFIANDTKAIEFISNFKPEYVELHSVWLNVPNLNNHILKNLTSNTKIVIGIGGCTIKEIESALNNFNNREVILMFGFQNYPTKYSDINLSKIRKIQSLFPKNTFGYADHTAWNEPNNELISLLVAENKMSYLEKHVTNVHGQERIDFNAAISIGMFNSLYQKAKLINQIEGNGSINLSTAEKKYSVYGPMKMAALAKDNFEKGHVFSSNDISFKRTKEKTDLSQIEIISLFGKSFTKKVLKNEVINSSHFIKFK